MRLHNVYIQNIKKANENDRLAIFVGAGVSKSSDTDYIKLPLWRDLINELKSDLSITEDFDYLKLAQLYYLEFGEQVYNKKIKKFFPEDISPSTLHLSILKMNPRLIITTNWDCILEAAIVNEGYLYDTICTDKDLVNSTSPNKFIKIHGDFKSHNIVFKEDDYINYSRNFPLIENYVKSIFSTHTVLFVGYSYSDINLKHIMKWVQSHSNSAPPMYLLSFENNKSQESYLKNHGITTVILDSKDYSTDDAAHLDHKSALTQSFLKTLSQEGRAVNLDDDQDVIDFIYERLSNLKNLSAINLSQVRKSLTNCGYVYVNDGTVLLRLFNVSGIVTTDYSERIRKIHERYIEVVSQVNSFDVESLNAFLKKYPKFKDILSILALANIKGIVISKDNESGDITYLENILLNSVDDMKEMDRKHMSFSTCVSDTNDFIKSLSFESYELYKIGNYKQAFKKNSELIIACKRHRIYSMLLIALFNRNAILWMLKWSLSSLSRDEYQNELEADLQDEFFKFPRTEIKANQELYDFLSLNSIHERGSECTRKILDITKAVANIKSGGFSFNSEANEPMCAHINLLMFSLKNHVMIDFYEPFKAVMRNFVKISILRQTVNEVVQLNQYELYSAINFYNAKDLVSELEIFSKREGTSQLFLFTNHICRDWLTTIVLPNLTNLLIKDKSLIGQKNTAFENCVRLLAFLDLNDVQIEKTMNEFSRLINSSATTIGIYEAINEFLAYQHDLFNREIGTEVLIGILDTVIDKFISRKAHGWDQHAITQGSINNLYGYIGVAKGKYVDKVRVNSLVQELSVRDSEEQRRFSKSILYSIFNISNASVRDIVKRFVKKVISKNSTNNIQDVEFELWSIAVGFKSFEVELLEKLHRCLEDFRDGKSFSTIMYRLKSLTQYLIDNKGVESLKGLDDELAQLIDAHAKRPNYSSI